MITRKKQKYGVWKMDHILNITAKRIQKNSLGQDREIETEST